MESERQLHQLNMQKLDFEYRGRLDSAAYKAARKRLKEEYRDKTTNLDKAMNIFTKGASTYLDWGDLQERKYSRRQAGEVNAFEAENRPRNMNNPSWFGRVIQGKTRTPKVKYSPSQFYGED
jgi:hypothetical protein